jgi:hypothetical protein
MPSQNRSTNAACAETSRPQAGGEAKNIVFPIGNVVEAPVAGGPSRTLVLPNDKVGPYADRIRTALGRSASAILDTASIIAEARDALDHASFGMLAERVGVSKGTLSKFISIHSRRCRFEDRVASLPTAWTVVYGLSKLPDRQFDSLASSGKLRPGLTEQDVNRFVATHAHAGIRAALASDLQAYLPVKIAVPALLSAEREDDIRRKIIEAIADEPDVVATFAARRKLERRRG